MLLPIINWALGLLFTRLKLPRILFVFTEIILVTVTLLAISATLLDYYLVLNRQECELLMVSPFRAYAPYLCCLFIIQVFYVRQGYKISYIFITNALTLVLALPAFYVLPSIILYSMPIYLYVGTHTFVLTICEIFCWDQGKIAAFLRKQTWIRKIGLLESMLPKKNINAYVLSSTASFCYSSLNLCVLLSYKTLGIPEYVALGFTCIIVAFSGIITFALLVKYDKVENVTFPGCLIFHYITQAYERSKNVISGNVGLKPSVFTLRTLLFTLVLIIDALGSTAFAGTCFSSSQEAPSSPVSYPTGEGAQLSRAAQAGRQTMSWVGSEMAQGASEIPRNTVSSIGSLSTAAAGATMYSAAASYIESGTEGAAAGPSTAEVEALRAENEGLKTENQELRKALEQERNKSFFQRYFKCFGKQSNE